MIKYLFHVAIWVLEILYFAKKIVRPDISIQPSVEDKDISILQLIIKKNSTRLHVLIDSTSLDEVW